MCKIELNDEQKSILKQCIWDLNLSIEEFYAILTGKLQKRWPDQAFCIARLIESVNWFKIVKIIDPKELCRLWTEDVKRRIRHKTLKEGMEFACRILF